MHYLVHRPPWPRSESHHHRDVPAPSSRTPARLCGTPHGVPSAGLKNLQVFPDCAMKGVGGPG